MNFARLHVVFHTGLKIKFLNRNHARQMSYYLTDQLFNRCCYKSTLWHYSSFTIKVVQDD